MRFFPPGMRRSWIVLRSLLLLLLFVPSYSIPAGMAKKKQPSKSPADDQAQAAVAAAEEIRQLITKYATSVDKADMDLASQVWLDSPDVTFIHPAGHEHGFDQIKQDVYKHLVGETFSEGMLTVHDVSVHVYHDAAWAEFYWDFAAKLRKDGSPVATHGRETQIYWKIEGRWRLVHVHYSGMPAKE